MAVPLPYLALALADVALAATDRTTARRLTKPLLMPALLPGRAPATRTALALGWAGDVALLSSGPAALPAGLGCFLAGHAAWIAALRTRPSTALVRRRPLRALPYAAAWLGLSAHLWPRTGSLRVPVLVYGAALTGTALVALDTGRPPAAAGGALFLASDTLLALGRFAGVHLPGGEALVMATYTAAQALLAEGG